MNNYNTSNINTVLCSENYHDVNFEIIKVCFNKLTESIFIQHKFTCKFVTSFFLNCFNSKQNKGFPTSLIKQCSYILRILILLINHKAMSNETKTVKQMKIKET